MNRNDAPESVPFDRRDPRRNQLLAALPAAGWQRLQAQLEWVEMPLGQILYEPGSTPSHMHFPTTAIVSLLHVMEDGTSIETAVVGCEGVVGTSLFLAGESATSRALVHSAGEGYRLRADAVRAEMRHPEVMNLLLRFTQALIAQTAQTAACNRHHALDQQLSRWLLRSLDRLHGNELAMTQELIASLLGVRREGITEAALKLQEAGCIKYARGHIRLLDRAGLERRACECYRAVKTEYDRLLPRRAQG